MRINISIFYVLICWLIYFNSSHSMEIQTAELKEPRKIVDISLQTDWDMWLLGYRITLNDGSIWFSERGPLDYWDWTIGDEVRIELFNDQKVRRVLNHIKNPAMGNAYYRIININCQDFDEFQLLAAPDLSFISLISEEGEISLADHSQWLTNLNDRCVIKNWMVNDFIILTYSEYSIFLINDRLKEMIEVCSLTVDVTDEKAPEICDSVE